MAKSVQFQSGNSSQTSSTVRFLPWGNTSHSLLTATELNVNTPIAGEGFTLTRLSCYIYANTRSAGTAEIRLRKNTADGNNVCSIPFGTTGHFTDSSNSDTITTSDSICIAFKYGTGGTGQIDLKSISSVIDTATANTITRLNSYLSANLASGTSYSEIVDGSLSYNATEANAQVKISAGTLQNMYVYNTPNSRDGDSPITYRINGVDSALTVTLLDTNVGPYPDNTHTATVAEGDLVVIKAVRGGSGGSVGITICGCNFVTTDDSFISVMPGAASVVPGSATSYYLPIGGEADTASTEAQQKQRFYLTDFNANKMRIHLTTNSVASTSSFKLRKNGADTALSISITASTTGLFEDTSNSVSIASGDDINYILNAGGAGTITMRYASIRFYKSAGAAANPNLYTMFFSF